MTAIICPYCKGVVDVTQAEEVDKYVKNKDDLKDYPNCFSNFMDCPKPPEDINKIEERCKKCPYYQYSNFKNDKFIVSKANKENNIISKKTKDMFNKLTPEQQDEILKNL